MGKDILLKSIKLQNGETLGYRESGFGDKVIVLIHGNMTSSKHWDILMEALPNDYKVYAVDLRGFGISTYNNPIDSIKDFSEDFKIFVDELGLKDFFLAGWSTGGGVAMQFVANYPNYAKKLILVESVGVKGYPVYPMDANGTPLSNKPYQSKEELGKDTVSIIPVLEAYKNKDKSFLKNLWDAVIYTHNKPSESKYDEYLDDMLTQVNILDVYWALSKFNITHISNGLTQGTGEVNNIAIPTLVIQGERDFVIAPAIGKEIKETIGDNATLLILESGHSPLVDCLDVLVANIINFIEK